MNRTFGTDPEFGVLVDGVLTPPAYFFENGLQYQFNNNKKKEIINTPQGSIIEDGASFEFNVNPEVSGSLLYFNIRSLQSKLEYLIDTHTQSSQNIVIFDGCVHEFDIAKFLDNTNELYDECRVFRCDEDFYPRIYKDLGLETEDGIVDASKHPLRYFGGHIHVQNMSNNPKIYEEVAEFAPTVFDFIVGLYNVIISTNVKDEKRRMKIYGRPGRGRLQKYSSTITGYEYRPLSVGWLKDTSTIGKMLNFANLAASVIESGYASEFVDDMFIHIPNMWETILSMNKPNAKVLIQKSIGLALSMSKTSLRSLA